MEGGSAMECVAMGVWQWRCGNGVAKQQTNKLVCHSYWLLQHMLFCLEIVTRYERPFVALLSCLDLGIVVGRERDEKIMRS